MYVYCVESFGHIEVLDVQFVRILRVVIFDLFYCLLDLSCGECNVISMYFTCCSVNGSVCLVCCVFVNCLVKELEICLCVVVILLLNVMEVFCVAGGALLDRPCMVAKECACCACDPSVHLSVLSIGFVYVFVCGSCLLI